MSGALRSSASLPPSSGEQRSSAPRENLLRYARTQGLFVSAACSLCRFGSFEIFKQADEHTGRQGPSYGRDEIRGQMMDYVIEMFYPDIQRDHPDRVERNVAFFREVRARGSHVSASESALGS